MLFGLLLAALLPALAKSACSSGSPPASKGTRHNVTLSGGRTYMYFMPEKYDHSKPNPLILSFHGASRTADWQADLDRLTDPYFNKDHVVVYPQALQYGSTSSYIYWQGSPNATANDVAYVGKVLDEVESELCIDTSRVYATGKSQGGGMVGVLACDTAASQRFAAFSPVSGAFYTTGAASSLTSCGDPKTLAMTCNPGRDNIPLLDFHGGNDTTISILGGLRKGGCLPDVRTWVANWARRDGLSASPSATVAINGSAELYRYGSGADSGLVTFVYDGDHVNHDWPATFANTDNEDHGSGPATFNASTMIMEFFKKYSLPDAKDGDDGDGCSEPSSTLGNSSSSSTVTASSSGIKTATLSTITSITSAHANSTSSTFPTSATITAIISTGLTTTEASTALPSSSSSTAGPTASSVPVSGASVVGPLSFFWMTAATIMAFLLH
ncbi:hypothetical protein PFICI_09178 [Pestalotiopsis fici W106-1]|uniref:feruloyl esterase n=1 Tax=Pestalotiopsis fici (strain W106-1 / CGMCC3.15140) TaxID=1229662 RepID=W3WZQ5_PESFW|nr:uncharacterized protein PFICI_09178 [Pestalotiopsis fici W106-1]ETS79325.1 hypothetical protein PFICI_09178 [Pestalotiopsis fici W106-1]